MRVQARLLTDSNIILRLRTGGGVLFLGKAILTKDGGGNFFKMVGEQFYILYNRGWYPSEVGGWTLGKTSSATITDKGTYFQTTQGTDTGGIYYAYTNNQIALDDWKYIGVIYTNAGSNGAWLLSTYKTAANDTAYNAIDSSRQFPSTSVIDYYFDKDIKTVTGNYRVYLYGDHNYSNIYGIFLSKTNSKELLVDMYLRKIFNF